MNEEPTILIVDDDPAQREVLIEALSELPVNLLQSASPLTALEMLTDESIQLLISDVRMGAVSGLDLMERALQMRPGLPILLVTAYPAVRDAVNAMQQGAVNYLEKPVDRRELHETVTKTLGLLCDTTVQDVLPSLPEWMVAESAAMRKVLADVARVAPFDARVLICGESGTGKEVIAKLLHTWSQRASGPLVRVNCAAIPENLLESELFGHEKGAFTGAVKQRVGRFEEAAGGTIFLDEIGEVPLSLQPKLLRVLQEGTFSRVGANEELVCKARVVAATNRDLEAEVAAGNFREDLYFRLNVIEIFLPALRARREDIIPLARAFCQRFAQQAPRFASAVAAGLLVYEWPGNVRELQNAMERAVLMASGGLILPEHLPRRLAQFIGELPGESQEVKGETGRIETMEKALILQTLRENEFNRTRTAEVLGISRRTLTYKLNELAEAGYEIKASLD